MQDGLKRHPRLINLFETSLKSDLCKWPRTQFLTIGSQGCLWDGARWLQDGSRIAPGSFAAGFGNQSRSLSHGSQQSKNAFPAVRLSNSQFIVHNQHITQSSKTKHIELKNKSRAVSPPLLQAEKTQKIAILLSTRSEPLKTTLNS